uniref:Uncharacterized protein n=1 Tax=Rhizophora mucronata TaxID=61149 RepID=A0A2P2QUG8_RHIMU
MAKMVFKREKWFKPIRLTAFLFSLPFFLFSWSVSFIHGSPFWSIFTGENQKG